jgi:8-oxo-dGTP pyrophosphatase MutT (NUDIX family)
MEKYTIVVNGVVFDKELNKILIIKRKEGLQKGKWAFPGGKLENETILEGLKREIKEEVNLDIENKKEYIADYQYKREDGSLSLGLSFLVFAKNEDICKNEEIEDFKWVIREDLINYDLVEGLEEEALIAFQKVENGI